MSQHKIILKRGDTRTAIRATLLESSGSPADLSGAVVRFIMADFRGNKRVAREVEIMDAAQGKVRIIFEPPETDEAGTFRAEFEVQFADGRKETYPNNGYLTIEIIPDLG